MRGAGQSNTLPFPIERTKLICNFAVQIIFIMLQKLKLFKERHPFTSLMLIAIAARILVVVFAQGYGSNHEVQHTTLFLGFVDKIKEVLGIGQTVSAKLVSRSLYALVSLFTVSMIYRICDLASNKQTAWLLALIPAFSCIMPSFGIIENASAFLGLPLLLYGSNVVLRQEVLRQNNLKDNVHRTSFLVAGLILGLGICVWYESAFVVLSILIILFIRRNPKGALLTLLGVVASIVAVGLLLLALHVNPLNYIRL